jgi:hypothetical protein
MIDITLKCQEKNICKKIHSFHHYSTWFLVTISVLTPYWEKFKNKKQKKKDLVTIVALKAIFKRMLQEETRLK